MSRKETTKILTEAVSGYLIHKLYAVHPEFGVGRRGQRRLDVLAVNMKGDFVGIEVKSCKADYTSDSKWMEYLPYVNRLYLLLPPKMIESKFYQQILEDIKPHGMGVMTLCPVSGFIRVIKSAKRKPIDDAVMMKTLMKMAWRNGVSKRTVKRRRRLYLED